jgi:Na+/H+ antiporter NhaD/arsenite permease-like protein
MDAALSIAIFALAYILIATEKINKTVVAVLGASLILILKLITFEQAVHSVDFNVIFLLVGLMTTVSILSKTGFFEWVAVGLAKKTGGNPILIMVVLLLITAVFSAFLDNVTTVILLVPVTILITQILEISPIPFVILEAVASNIGGTATLIGDPPNIIIGSEGNLTFNDFIVNLTPVIILVLIFAVVTASVAFRKRLQIPVSIRKRVSDAIPNLAIVDKSNLIKSLVVLGLMIAAFFCHTFIRLEPGVIALAGSMVLMLICRKATDEALMQVEWSVIFFFIGLFMMISALVHTGVIAWIAGHLLRVAGHNLLLLSLVVLWASAVLSSVLDNIPFVMVMIPLLKLAFSTVAAEMGITDPQVIQSTIAEPLWWSLSLGVCLGGNGTLIGASANVVAARICERNGYHISFGRFSKYGIVFTFQALLICTAYIWLRYFYFA